MILLQLVDLLTLLIDQAQLLRTLVFFQSSNSLVFGVELLGRGNARFVSAVAVLRTASWRRLLHRSLSNLVIRFAEVGIGVGVGANLVLLRSILVCVDRLVLPVALSALAASEVVLIDLSTGPLINVVP